MILVRRRWINAGRIWPERMEQEVLDKYKVEDSKREATRWNGGLLAEARTTEKKLGRRLLGKSLLPCSERVQPAASAKQAGRINGRRRDEAATKNEYYEGCDEK